jgi:hypothetical protein
MRFKIVSLTNPTAVRRILRRIARMPQVRGEAFQEIARNAKLQRKIFTILRKQPLARNTFILELSKNLKLRRTILRLADQR